MNLKLIFEGLCVCWKYFYASVSIMFLQFDSKIKESSSRESYCFFWLTFGADILFAS